MSLPQEFPGLVVGAENFFKRLFGRHVRVLALRMLGEQLSELMFAERASAVVDDVFRNRDDPEIFGQGLPGVGSVLH